MGKFTCFYDSIGSNGFLALMIGIYYAKNKDLYKWLRRCFEKQLKTFIDGLSKFRKDDYLEGFLQKKEVLINIDIVIVKILLVGTTILIMLSNLSPCLFDDSAIQADFKLCTFFSFLFVFAIIILESYVLFYLKAIISYEYYRYSTESY